MDPSFFSCRPEYRGEVLLCCAFPLSFLGYPRYVNPRQNLVHRRNCSWEISARERGFFDGIRLLLCSRSLSISSDGLFIVSDTKEILNPRVPRSDDSSHSRLRKTNEKDLLWKGESERNDSIRTLQSLSMYDNHYSSLITTVFARATGTKGSLSRSTWN